MMRDLVYRFIGGTKGARAIGVLLLSWGIFLVISLVSHSVRDFPNSSRLPSELINWGGYAGAWVSYSAFTAVGYAAYAVPILVLLWGWNRIRCDEMLSAVYRSAGVLSLALLFSIGSAMPKYSSYTAFKMGGWLGTQVSNLLLIPYAGRVGSTILLSALFVAALIVTTDTSVRRCGVILLAAGACVARPFGMLWRIPSRVRGHFRRRRLAVEQTLISSSASPESGSFEEFSSVAEHAVNGGSNGSESFVDGIAEAIPVKSGSRSNGKKSNGKPAKSARSEPGLSPTKISRGKYRPPVIGLLTDTPAGQGDANREDLQSNAALLEKALANFDVGGRIVEVSPGPVVTRYEVEPAPGVKVNRIVTLADDLARVMSANGIRIQAPVPGKSVVGVEIANNRHEIVYLSEILESRAFRKSDSKLTIALGKTISGEPYVADLARMPHLLVAGATGSGKSVCINSIISSLLFKSTPDDVRLLMVDPKVVELTMYNDIPHLLIPVITEPKKASEALKWTVAEMEARYQKLAKLGVRNLVDYNAKVGQIDHKQLAEGEEPPKHLPYIVAIIDEFADLMLTAPADVETSLMSLAQKSRAVGIHIILATQRPSVNVITGVIKANFPSRIAFQVASKTDSRTILDCNGAERLLGRGDMLFLAGGQGEPVRIHGAFVSGEETEKLVAHISSSGYEAEEVAVLPDHGDIITDESSRDELFEEAVRLVVEYQQASTSFLQRRMKIGYSRAARLMDGLEAARMVGPADGAKPREILVEAEDEEALAESDSS